MKRICSVLLTLCLLFGLGACGQKGPTWEEQYDLGVKYLSEGNYEEAIIAFTAAIEIEPNRAEAYIGRGGAYIGSGETAENLAAALADYEQAASLDATNPEAWLGMADVYIRMGEYDKALEILRQGLDKTGNDESIAGKIAEMEAGTFADASGKTRKSCYYENGELVQYWLYEYDEAGNNVKTTSYMADGTWEYTEESTFNEQGQEISSVTTDSHGGSSTETYTYDAQGRRIREDMVDQAGDTYYTYYSLISYDEQARTETHDEYTGDGELEYRFVIEYDADGVRRKGSNYVPDENGQLYLSYYVEYIWNADGSYGGFHHYDVAGEQDE